MTATTRTVLALRFGDQAAPASGTIGAHQRVLTESGSVFFGKMGAAIALDRFLKTFPLGTQDQLLLVKGMGSSGLRPQGWFATVGYVGAELPDGGLELVPSYYRRAADEVGTWFEITALREATTDELRGTTVISSKRPLFSILSRSTANTFYCQVGCPPAGSARRS